MRKNEKFSFHFVSMPKKIFDYCEVFSKIIFFNIPTIVSELLTD